MTNYTIRPFKGRSVEVGDKIKAYRNLHHRDWSIVALTGPYKGLVVAHSDELPIWGPTFLVNLAGRQRTIRDGRKNVHAFVLGTLGGHVPRGKFLTIRNQVRYNPFLRPSFWVYPRGIKSVHDRVSWPQPIYAGGLAQLDIDGRAWVYAPRGVS